MSVSLTRTLADFGTRSLVTHAIMVVTFAATVVTGLFVSGQVGLISFVAFLNFTAGMWVCQSIHSLGNTARGDDYEGVLKELQRYVQ